MDDESEDLTTYDVVINDEEQYSIWPADRDPPAGWHRVDKRGPKADCLAYVDQMWTDMRPLSLRKAMEEAARNPPPGPEVDHAEAAPDDLVARLATGDHPIEVVLRPEKTVSALKERLDRGFVHLKFTDTRGGTELGVRLDPNAIAVGDADFTRQTGRIHLEGDLTLNLVRVRCIADVDLGTFSGCGHLEPVQT